VVPLALPEEVSFCFPLLLLVEALSSTGLSCILALASEWFLFVTVVIGAFPAISSPLPADSFLAAGALFPFPLALRVEALFGAGASSAFESASARLLLERTMIGTMIPVRGRWGGARNREELSFPRSEIVNALRHSPKFPTRNHVVFWT